MSMKKHHTSLTNENDYYKMHSLCQLKMYLGYKLDLFLYTLFILAIYLQAATHGVTAKGKEIGPNDIPIIVLSQPNIYHAQRAAIFRDHILQQLQQERIDPVHLLHEKWPHPGAWTILPILPKLLKQFQHKLAIFFCEEETRISLNKLYKALNSYDLTEELFLGKALHDEEATIIHHFAFYKNPNSFLYPDFSAGFILSLPLVKSLVARITAHPLPSDFSIDPKHELAMFIWNDGAGLYMTGVDFLCTKPGGENCATTFPQIFPLCGTALADGDIFFAVKTCSKYHTERVPVVKDTWAKDTMHIEYYSDVEDTSIPTIDLGIPNTENGHCSKTMAIIKRFRQHNAPLEKQYKWLVITDDDTLLSVPTLRRLLPCYDHREPVVLGERYGYGVSDANTGYNYVTGGGGMVFSFEAVKMIVDLGQCWCAGDDSPDDMMLGLCFKHLGIIPVHSPYFHQARPMDYCKSFLDHQLPVSFHKHWMIDPRRIYKEWLAPEQIYNSTSHEEL